MARLARCKSVLDVAPALTTVPASALAVSLDWLVSNATQERPDWYVPRKKIAAARKATTGPVVTERTVPTNAAAMGRALELKESANVCSDSLAKTVPCKQPAP